jgi:hypothetical protein
MDLPKTESIAAPVKAIQFASILAHVRANNVSYLLAIGIAHMLGITERAWVYGSGMC